MAHALIRDLIDIVIVVTVSLVVILGVLWFILRPPTKKRDQEWRDRWR